MLHDLDAFRGYPMLQKREKYTFSFIATDPVAVGDKLIFGLNQFTVQSIDEQREPKGVPGVHKQDAVFYRVDCSFDYAVVKKKIDGKVVFQVRPPEPVKPVTTSKKK